MRPLSTAGLVLAGLVGVVVGLVYAIAEAARSGTPVVLTGLGLVTLVLVVLGLVVAARYMSRVKRRTAPVDPLLAVRILVLGRTGAVVGAVVAGLYLGIGVQRVGSGLTAGGGGRQVVLAGLGVLAGLAVTVAGLVVERACRRPDDPDDPDDPTVGPTATAG